MKNKLILTSVLLLLINLGLFGQNFTQTIKGRIIDSESKITLPGANIVLMGTNPLIGTVSDMDGNFTLRNVSIGRYDIRVSFIGYNDKIINEVLVSSGKEVVLTIELKEKIITSSEVVIKANKGDAINSMASVSARQITVEEASRYAGGFDDPARLASSFAGVSGNLGNNGIVIRGNAPKGLLWRMEDVEITNPSHFANLGAIGAGAITALSSQVMSNSDFYTGAFPSEYGNALSGVFDIKLRTGNQEKREYTLQAGLIGIDVASEGPFINGKKASYLFNYRYSTMTLLEPILPPEMGKLKYQDLSFKLNFPLKKPGSISVWGIGALDYQGRNANSNISTWETDLDKTQYGSDLFMGALGINNKLIFNNKTYTNFSLAVSGNGILLNIKEYDNNLILIPKNKIENTTTKYTLTGFINHKFNTKHTNKSGFSVDKLIYDINIQKNNDTTLSTYADGNGSSYLIRLFSQSKFSIIESIDINTGINSQIFLLNNHYSIEPRVAISWNIKNKQKIAFSYGLHSQLEMLNFYFVQHNTPSRVATPNKDLDFSKAHHFVLSYEIGITDNIRLKIEPYFQKLFSIPIIPNSANSLQNLESGIYFNDSLVNKGSGKNLGIDITFERFLNKGFYYLVTTSLFDSKYKGGDGIERNSRFNKNYVINILGGKEWIIGKNKNKILGFNLKLCLMGGDYTNPIDYKATYLSKDIVENLSKAFTERKPDAQILSTAISYKINKKRHASTWSFSFINVLGYKEINSYYYDKTSNSIKQDINQLVMPNLSYKLEF